MEVESIEKTGVTAIVLNSGELTSRKGVNLPAIGLDFPSLTDKDIRDIDFGLEIGVDMMALSFVRSAKNVRDLRAIIDRQERSVPVIAKIEKPQAIEEIDDIITAVDGIMIARGDLAVEIPMEKVPILQKQLIAKAKQANIPVIVATQMLESMTANERPTRAEVTDVAGAVFDGSDAVMLSGETAAGKHPEKVVKRMDSILKEAEKTAYNSGCFAAYNDFAQEEFAVAAAAVAMAKSLKAVTLVTPTKTGLTAELVSRHRTNLPILALSARETTVQKLTLRFGVITRNIPEIEDFENMLKVCHDEVITSGLGKKGDYIIVLAGHPFDRECKTNLVKAVRLGMHCDIDC